MAKRLRDRRTGDVSYFFEEQVPLMLNTGWYEMADAIDKKDVPVLEPKIEEDKIEYPEPVKIGRRRTKKGE